MPPEDDHEAALRQALGRVIAMRRAELGLKRNDLRDRSQLSYPYVAELEHGTKRPSQSALQAIAEALELRPSELLERAEALIAGEPLWRSDREERSSSWFHAAGAPMAPTAMSMPTPEPRRRRSPTIDDDLRAAIEDVVREVVRDELQRAGIEPAPRKRRVVPRRR